MKSFQNSGVENLKPRMFWYPEGSALTEKSNNQREVFSIFFLQLSLRNS